MSSRARPFIDAVARADAARRLAEAPARDTGLRRPDIDPRRCTGCGRCVAVCEPRVLSLEVQQWDKRSVLHDPARCTGCSACAAICPFHAITMRPPATP
ncbi:MAG: 4Fe-4S dicluster domain-containing protein [Burkholderiales bacterium]|nr:4Fe-4S dicluster domain-containing protein [Burkholderiales bacterium]